MSKYLFLFSVSLIASAAHAQDAQQQRQDAGDAAVAEILARQGAPAPATAPTARPDQAPASSTDAPTITVTANGLSTSIESTGQPVTLIDRREIDAIQGADIARVLARVPSVSLTRNGPLGSYTGVSVRGADPDQLLVLIDGVRVADPSSPAGGFDFGTLLASNIGRIDFLRGSNSTIWGADAMGGVVDITTSATPGVAASVEYGARGTLTTQASAGIKGDGYNVGLYGGTLSTDGFSAAADGTEPDGLNQWSVGGSAHIDLTPQLEAFANGRYSHADLDIDGYLPDFSFGDTLDTQRTKQYSGALGLAYYGMDLTLRGAWSFSDTARDNFDANDDPTFTGDGHSDMVSLRGEYRLIGGLTLAFGGEHERTSYQTSYDAHAATSITGGYLQAGWVLGKLAAHAGARVDDHDRFGSKLSLGGDISYGLGHGWRLRTSYGEGFKPPTLYQLYSDYGNEQLRPETSTSVDFGIEHGTRGEGTHFALTAFRRDSSQLITFVSCFGVTDGICTNRPFGTYDNTDRARAQGIELEAGTQLAPGLRLAGTYTHLTAEDRGTGLDLARRPRDTATIYADYTAPFGVTLGGQLRLVGPSYDNGTNTVRLDGYTLADITASVPLTHDVEVFGRVENIFDETYQTAAGYGSPGRGAFIGVRGRM
ncbi:MAG: TonB-dependent receptor [Sphingomonadaceae bacterium]